MNEKAINERYQAWVDAVNKCWKHGWKCKNGWVFQSPSGTLHDLSAADLDQLFRIEYDGLFVTKEDEE
jgi:hypothetical protein